MARVIVIGGGLAGCECALQLARRGVKVTLYEQRPLHSTGAHHTAWLSELVCSNSLKSLNPASAQGLLKQELRQMGSELLAIAFEHRVKAGGALAVERNAFAQAVTAAIESNPAIELIREEVTHLPATPCVLATGPLTSHAMAKNLETLLGSQSLAFFDAAAPIVDATSIDRSVAFSQDRYGKGSGDYLNCPMNKEEYDAFIDALVSAERVVLREFETADLFCACQPIEEIARSGKDAPRFGPLKPVGLTDPRTGKRPWACVQLRAEDGHQSAYNLVGFQTNLTFGAQKRVFRMIPGLENASFFRYGVMHRNTFVDAPRTLDGAFKVPGRDLWLAGQLTGTEGYVEAMASGLLAALNVVSWLTGKEEVQLPTTSAFGSLVAWATNPTTKDYQPMHVNFGIIAPLDPPVRNKRQRYEAYATRAQNDLSHWMKTRSDLFGER